LTLQIQATSFGLPPLVGRFAAFKACPSRSTSEDVRLPPHSPLKLPRSAARVMPTNSVQNVTAPAIKPTGAAPTARKGPTSAHEIPTSASGAAQAASTTRRSVGLVDFSNACVQLVLAGVEHPSTPPTTAAEHLHAQHPSVNGSEGQHSQQAMLWGHLERVSAWITAEVNSRLMPQQHSGEAGERLAHVHLLNAGSKPLH
jgi:hypothetical protein